MLSFIRQVVSDSLTPWIIAHQASLSFTISGVCSNSCPLSQGCHPTISSFVTPFFSCPQSFSASGSFPISQLFASGGFSTGASALASVLPMNIQGWFPLGLTGLICLLSKGLSISLLQHSRFQLGGLNFPPNVLKQDWMATGVLFYLYAFSLTGN